MTARWHRLVMLNWAVEPELLLPFVPRGTQLDAFAGNTYLSVVGFLFDDTRIFGLRLPFYRSFAEVNLRFYVMREAEDGLRRGVVFIKEYAGPRPAAWIARYVYGENYHTAKVSLAEEDDGRRCQRTLRWKIGRHRYELAAAAGEPLDFPAAGSFEEFVVEHYLGYSAISNGGTMEYAVKHRPWQVARAEAAHFRGDVAAMYGPKFVEPLGRPPDSAFLVDGSDVIVYRGTRLPREAQSAASALSGPLSRV